MSLVTGRGPLSKDPAGWFSPPLPDDVVFVEPHPRRVQAMRDGAWCSTPSGRCSCTVPDARCSSRFRPTRSATFRTNPSPRHRDTCTCRGTRWTPGSRRAATSSIPAEPVPPGRLPSDEPRAAGHGRRHDAGRHLDTMIVFETALAPVLYVGRRMCAPTVATLGNEQLLQLQGLGHYWSAVIGDSVVDDVAWSYDDPLPETSPSKDISLRHQPCRRRCRTPGNCDFGAGYAQRDSARRNRDYQTRIQSTSICTGRCPRSGPHRRNRRPRGSRSGTPCSPGC